MNKLRVFKTNN